MTYTVFIAELDTRNFSFRAAGDSKASAKRALIFGLDAHGQEYDIPKNWHKQFHGDINITPMILHCAYRDGQLLEKVVK